MELSMNPEGLNEVNFNHSNMWSLECLNSCSFHKVLSCFISHFDNSSWKTKQTAFFTQWICFFFFGLDEKVFGLKMSIIYTSKNTNLVFSKEWIFKILLKICWVCLSLFLLYLFYHEGSRRISQRTTKKKDVYIIILT